jgi:phosphatidylinositol alpha 1,6-mannosyltransferase
VAIFQTDVAGYARRNRLGAATRFAWRVVRRIHDGADLTLVPSSASMRDLEAAGVERLARWGRGVDLETYHPNNRLTPTVQRLRQRLAPHGETIVGYVGRIAPEKQVERLAVLRGLEGVRLVIVGDGPSVPHAKRVMKGMPVTWLGALSGGELAAAYASFDVFVHTGNEETFGQTVQEAHASGLPVIAPHAGGPIDLVEHGVDGYLFSPEDDAALRFAVEQLVDQPERRARMGEAGRRKVLRRSWASVGDELIGHYEKVVAARAAEDGLLTREAAGLVRGPRFD